MGPLSVVKPAPIHCECYLRSVVNAVHAVTQSLQSGPFRPSSPARCTRHGGTCHGDGVPVAQGPARVGPGMGRVCRMTKLEGTTGCGRLPARPPLRPWWAGTSTPTSWAWRPSVHSALAVGGPVARASLSGNRPHRRDACATGSDLLGFHLRGTRGVIPPSASL